MLRVDCPGCGKTYHVKDELAGRKLRCTQCSAVIQAPSAPALPSVVASAPPPVPPPPISVVSPPQLLEVRAEAPLARYRRRPKSRTAILVWLGGTAALAALAGTLWATGFFSSSPPAQVASSEATGPEAAAAEDPAPAETAVTADVASESPPRPAAANPGAAVNAPPPQPAATVPEGPPVRDTSQLQFPNEPSSLLACNSAEALTFSPDGALLIAAGQVEDAPPWLAVWDVATWAKRQEVAPSGVPATLLFTPDGDSLVTVSGEDERIAFLDPQTLAVQRELTASGTVIALAISPDGRTLATITSDTWQIQLWEEGRPTQLWSGPGAPTTGLAFSADGRQLASSGEKTLVWDVAQGAIVRDLSADTEGASSFGAAFAPDGSRLAIACNDSQIRLWSLPALQQTPALENEQPNVFAARFAPDGRTLLTRSMDGFDPSDRLSIVLALASGANLRIWNVASGQFVQLSSDVCVMKTHSFAFSPDGTTIAATGKDGIAIWVGR